MNQLNSIILEGNITRDVVFKETPYVCALSKFSYLTFIYCFH